MQQKSIEGPSLRGTFHFFYVIVSAVARCVTPMMRDRAGPESNTWAGLAALIGMVFYSGIANDTRVLTYLGVWLIALLVQRMNSLVCRGRGMLIHSHYTGRPWLALLIAPFIKDERAARLVIEPLICMGAAWLLTGWSPAVAKLVAHAGVAIVIVELIDQHQRSQSEQAVINSRLEMQELANGVRDRIGF